MRRASPARLEKLFAVIVMAGAPAGMLGVLACSTGGTEAGSGGSGSSSGSTFPPCGPLFVTLDGALPDAMFDDAQVAECCQSGGSCCPQPGALSFAVCELVCNTGDVQSCSIADSGPPIVVTCVRYCPGGRRPADLRCERVATDSPLGRYFVSLAQLEAASVPAFRRMARELARFGAPRRLVRAAERAAREEVRHARGAMSLAKRYGAKRASFTADVRGERSLEEFATENAIEGCVRETYGALVATWQAREAADPLVRVHMARIAKEETTHAALAWKTDAWARGRLAKDARERVKAARANAARELAVEVARTNVDEEIARVAGLPARATARRLAFELAATFG